MSAMTLLLGLLVVAYIGSLFMGGRALRGYGLPSGSEWIVLGFVLGPSVSHVVSHQALAVFEPIAAIAMAWLALVLGTEYGFAGTRRVRLGGFVAGIGSALICAAAVSGAVYAAAIHFTALSQGDALRVAVGIGLASCEISRYAVRWAATRSGTHGPIHDFLEDMADSDEVVPLLGIGVLFAFSPGAASVTLTPWHWLGITIMIGVLLGLVCSMLLRGLPRVGDAWGVLVGAALLGTGIAWRLGLSPLTAMFLMGLFISSTSRHAPELRVMLARTEPAVLLPTMLLAGALVHFDTQQPFVIVVAVAVVARAIARTLLGRGVAMAVDAPKPMRMSLALGFWSSGALTTLVSLAFAFRFRGELGDMVLAAALSMTVLGELVGPLSLLRAFSQAGPRVSAADAPPPPPSPPAPEADGGQLPSTAEQGGAS